MVHKKGILCFGELNILSGALETSPGAWESFSRVQIKRCLNLGHQKAGSIHPDSPKRLDLEPDSLNWYTIISKYIKNIPIFFKKPEYYLCWEGIERVLKVVNHQGDFDK
jgi:hypothetical protein